MKIKCDGAREDNKRWCVVELNGDASMKVLHQEECDLMAELKAKKIRQANHNKLIGVFDTALYEIKIKL